MRSWIFKWSAIDCIGACEREREVALDVDEPPTDGVETPVNVSAPDGGAWNLKAMGAGRNKEIRKTRCSTKYNIVTSNATGIPYSH